jgi:hypothetical protein
MSKSVLYVIVGLGLALAIPSIIVLVIVSTVMGSVSSMLGGGGGIFTSIIGGLSLIGSLFSLVFVPILYNDENFDLAKIIKIVILVTGLLIILSVIIGVASNFLGALLFILGLVGGAGIAFFGFKGVTS